jgi:hypothetical protein
MTHLDLFRYLAPLVGPHLEHEFHRRDLCIAATRLAIHVGAYFGVEVGAQPCRVLAVNRQFAAHLEAAQAKGARWQDVSVRAYADVDGSHSVGIGWPGEHGGHPWPFHLVATGGGWIADFSIRQAERLDKGIKTGTALVATLAEHVSCVEKETGAVVHYWTMEDDGYRQMPDWKHRRTARLAGPLIRHIRQLRDSEQRADQVLTESECGGLSI